MAAKSRVVHVAVDRLTERMLKQQAKIEDAPVSAIIRRAINSYLAETAPEAAKAEQVSA